MWLEIWHNCHTKFEWDEAKDRLNQFKHGVAFTVAQLAFFDKNRVIPIFTRIDPFFCLPLVGRAIAYGFPRPRIGRGGFRVARRERRRGASHSLQDGQIFPLEPKPLSVTCFASDTSPANGRGMKNDPQRGRGMKNDPQRGRGMKNDPPAGEEKCPHAIALPTRGREYQRDSFEARRVSIYVCWYYCRGP